MHNQKDETLFKDSRFLLALMMLSVLGTYLMSAVSQL
jgi:hypothetical protein